MHNITEDQLRGSYDDIDHHEAGNGPESAEIGISNKGPKESGDIACPWPVGHVVRCWGIALVEDALHVIHQIGAHPVVCQSFAALVCWRGNKNGNNIDRP